MDKKATKRLAIVALVIMLGTILVHTPVNGFAQGQSATKVLRIGYFPNINHAQAVIGFGFARKYSKYLEELQKLTPASQTITVTRKEENQATSRTNQP